MPKGPRGEKRQADVMGNAVKIARIATGDEHDGAPARSAAAEMDTKVGEAPVKSMTPTRRTEIAKGPAAKRWAR